MTVSKNLLIFSAQYPPHMGGIERFTESLANELVSLGHSVTVVTNNTEDMASVDKISGLTVLRLPCFPFLAGRMPFPKRNLEYRKMVKRLLEAQYDGVLINTRFFLHSLLGLRVARKTMSRAIVLDHGSAHIMFGNHFIDPLVAAYEHLITSVMKRFKPSFYGISSKSVEWLEHFGIKGSGVITNSIDSSEYVKQASSRQFRKELLLSDSDCLVAFVGRLVPGKGVLELIEAVEDCEKGNIVLAVAGDGPLKERVEKSRSSRVRYLGRLSPADVSKFLLDSNVLCLPSRSEGFSTTLLEAAACATPSITTDVGGARELIPSDEYGIIIPDASPSAISSALCFAADHADEMMRMGRKASARMESQYSWRAVANCLLDAFND